ncbi:MAG: flippase-like domain-containing protein [Pirellulales bacterium]|nr:flippase-like domain-containing protein [Pirellulales bacterium]
MKRLLITLLKIAVSAAILGYLVWDATHGEEKANAFANLVDQPKHWGILAAAWAACAAAVLLTFIRWWYLVRALEIPCRFSDAIRIGFWGYLFNLAPLGIVGGDLVKAVMLDHEQPNHRAKALASVLVDRVIGLYILFIVASAAILLTGFWRIEAADIDDICWVTFGLTAVGALGLGFVMGPERWVGPAVRAVGRIPRAGPPLESLINAVRMYNRRPRVLILATAMTVGVHGLFAVGCYLIACGLPGNHPTMAQHFVIMPLSAAVQVIPVPVGPTEFALDYFYANIPVAGAAIAQGQGLVVSLVYRLISVLIAALGAFYYFGNRREIAEVIHEAEQEQ